MTAVKPGRFCSQDGRGWTDLYTNIVLFKDIDLSRHLGGIVAPETYRLPRELAPSFIHEATHHWCFHSTVGAVLAVLQLRAQRHVMAVAAGIRKGMPDAVADDMIRVDAAEECLRPLSEGLASFAEFDVTPRESSPKTSLPMWWTHYFFSNYYREDLNKGILETLDSIRSSPEMERRRRTVLAHDCTGSLGGYLPGYLAVKHMWLMAMDSERRFWNRDLFLMFLKSFIFADMGLAAILLDPDDRKDSAQRIVRHVESRLASFWKLDLSRALDEYIAALQMGGARAQGPHTVIGVDPAVTTRARELLAAELREVSEFATAPASELEQLRLRDGLTFARRDLMRLGSIDAIATSRDGALLLEEGGEPLMTLEQRPGVEFPRSTVVEVDLEASPAFDNLIIFVWHEGRLVGQGFATVPGGKGDGGETRNNTQANMYIGSRRDQDKYYSNAQKELDTLVPRDARQRTRDGMRAEFVEFLSEIALGQTPIPLRAGVWQKMAADGVAALIKDPDTLQQLSRIGLISSLTASRALTLKRLAELGITEADVHAVTAAGGAVNVPFLLLQDDILITIT